VIRTWPAACLPTTAALFAPCGREAAVQAWGPDRGERDPAFGVALAPAALIRGDEVGGVAACAAGLQAADFACPKRQSVPTPLGRRQIGAQWPNSADCADARAVRPSYVHSHRCATASRASGVQALCRKRLRSIVGPFAAPLTNASVCCSSLEDEEHDEEWGEAHENLAGIGSGESNDDLHIGALFSATSDDALEDDAPSSSAGAPQHEGFTTISAVSVASSSATGCLQGAVEATVSLRPAADVSEITYPFDAELTPELLRHVGKRPANAAVFARAVGQALREELADLRAAWLPVHSVQPRQGGRAPAEPPDAFTAVWLDLRVLSKAVEKTCTFTALAPPEVDVALVAKDMIPVFEDQVLRLDMEARRLKAYGLAAERAWCDHSADGMKAILKLVQAFELERDASGGSLTMPKGADILHARHAFDWKSRQQARGAFLELEVLYKSLGARRDALRSKHQDFIKRPHQALVRLP